MNGRRSAWGSRIRIAGGLLLTALILSGCGSSPSEEAALEQPATVEHLDGSDVARITLTQRAGTRLDIQTTPVQGRGDRLVVPSAAVLVDPNGVFWVYTSPEPLVFIRQRIEIDHEEGGRAFLIEGPLPGTQVVTIGVAELYGAEFEIGH